MTHEWMLEQTWELLLEYLAQMPQLELYRAYPVAQMMSIYANAQGGKKQGKGKKPRQDELFTALEFLPYYSQTDEVRLALFYGGTAFSPAQCRMIADAVVEESLPSWAIVMINSLQPIDVLTLAVKPHLRN